MGIVARRQRGRLTNASRKALPGCPLQLPLTLRHRLLLHAVFCACLQLGCPRSHLAGSTAGLLPAVVAHPSLQLHRLACTHLRLLRPSAPPRRSSPMRWARWRRWTPVLHSAYTRRAASPETASTACATASPATGAPGLHEIVIAAAALLSRVCQPSWLAWWMAAEAAWQARHALAAPSSHVVAAPRSRIVAGLPQVHQV